MARRASPSEGATLLLKLLNAFVRGVELTTQVRDQIDEPFGADPPLSHILFELVDGIHTPASVTDRSSGGIEVLM